MSPWPVAALHIALMVALAAFLRGAFFAGAVLPDDMVYVSQIDQIRQGGWPEISAANLWAARPLLLLIMRASLAVFGWNDVGLVAPFFAASIALVAGAYLVAAKFAGRNAGLLAALALAVCPLDLVYSTTVANDILASAFAWGGAAIAVFVIPFRCGPAAPGRDASQLALPVLGFAGFVTGCAAAVKLTGMIAGPIAVIAVWLATGRDERGKTLAPTAAFLAGWLVAQIALAAFIGAHTGDPFAHFAAERDYYLRSDWMIHDANPIRLLAAYPGWMSGLVPERYGSVTLWPFGAWWWMFALAAVVAWRRESRAVRAAIVATLLVLAVLEFAPLRLWPYVPIHRLPRVLHLALAPAAVAIGAAFAAIPSARRGFLVLALMVTSLIPGALSARVTSDIGRDKRIAAEYVQSNRPARVVTDVEMAQYLEFRADMSPTYSIDAQQAAPTFLPPGSLVIYGGSRRLEYTVDDAPAWREAAAKRGCRIVATSTASPNPWRADGLVVCEVPVIIDKF
ncbi:MAG: glycosyltransferase family 39 protein [Deltaproteobacteria bacterium]|nr:glycosyltransferase family 39 protein [Deltaproteobacteria bacterium]